MKGVDMDMVHRRVSAKDSPRPETSAPRSVFDVARGADKQRRTRQELPPFDADAIAIEKGVPVVTGSRGRKGEGPCAQLCRRLKVGESAKLPRVYIDSLRNAAKRIEKISGGKFAVAAIDSDVRVWRTA
jgi:hypothetical protein